MCTSLDKDHPCEGDDFAPKDSKDRVIFTMRLMNEHGIEDCNEAVPVEVREKQLKEKNKKSSKKQRKKKNKEKELQKKAGKYGKASKGKKSKGTNKKGNKSKGKNTNSLLALLLKSLQ